jgi:hypothetical protein
VSAISVLHRRARAHARPRSVGVRGAFASALDAARRIAGLADPASRSTRRSTACRCPSCPPLGDARRRDGRRGVADPAHRADGPGRRPAGPHPAAVRAHRAVSPLLGLAQSEPTRTRRRAGLPGEQHRVLRAPGRACCATAVAMAPTGTAAARASGAWAFEADGKIKACPSLPSDQYTGGYLQSDRLGEVIAGARRGHAPAQPHARRPLGLLRIVPLRRRLQGRLHLDVALHPGARRQQPLLHPPRARVRGPRRARAPRLPRRRARSAVRLRAVRPRGRAPARRDTTGGHTRRP